LLLSAQVLSEHRCMQRTLARASVGTASVTSALLCAAAGQLMILLALTATSVTYLCLRCRTFRRRTPDPD
jgi:hypothetical protein